MDINLKRKLLTQVLSAESDNDEEFLKKIASDHEQYKKRKCEGAVGNIYEIHLSNDEILFRKYLRLPPKLFYDLLGCIEKDLKSGTSKSRPPPLTPHQELCLTLRFLATGESQKTLGLKFRISKSYVDVVLQKVLYAITVNKFKRVMPEPKRREWKTISDKFFNRWKFPMCIGGIDGRHVRTINGTPENSIVVFVIVDPEHKFIAVDVAPSSGENEEDLFYTCILRKKIQFKLFKIPPPVRIGKTGIELPYVFVGSQAFLLTPFMMTPYNESYLDGMEDEGVGQYNSCLAKARKVVDIAFGMLNNVFRIFNTPIDAKPEVTCKIIWATCVLYNYLRCEKINMQQFIDDSEVPNTQEQCLTKLATVTDHSETKPKALVIRERFRSYFALESNKNLKDA